MVCWIKYWIAFYLVDSSVYFQHWKRSTIPLQPSVFNFCFQIIHISLECSTTLSSPLAPLSHHLPILVCCWLLLGSCRATCWRAAACLHGNAASDYMSQQVYRPFHQTRLMTVKFCLWHRDTYSDRSGSSTPDSEISELKLPSISNEWLLGTHNKSLANSFTTMYNSNCIPYSMVVQTVLTFSWTISSL